MVSREGELGRSHIFVLLAGVYRPGSIRSPWAFEGNSHPELFYDLTNEQGWRTRPETMRVSSRQRILHTGQGVAHDRHCGGGLA